MFRRDSEHRLTVAQRRLRLLQSEIATTATTATKSELAGLAADLEEALQELEVAHEELRQQNEELETTREALERERHRYLDLFDQAPYGYLVTDVHGVIEEANRAAAALLGIDPGMLAGKPFLLYVEEPGRGCLRQQLPRLQRGEGTGDLEVTVQPREGAPLPVVLTVTRSFDSFRQADRLRWMLRDVSQVKATEEALRQSEERLRHARRLESVGRLAGGIAHSFNNLLAAIAFHSELLAEQLAEGDDAQRAHVEEIQRAGERAAVLARQLLAFGRKQVLQPRILDLNGVARGMEPMLRRLVGEHIELAVRLDPDAATVHADLGQIEQVVLNLVVNARDAMPLGGRLTIGTANAEVGQGRGAAPDLPPGRYVKLWVEDTGTGMPPEVRARLFEPFFTTKERDRGTGLGLATVHGIVHQSGGGITVETEPGKGSRFSILLPRAERPAAAVEPARPARRKGARGSEVVLLVEDEDSIRQPAIEILQNRGYTVLAAGDAAEALELSRRHRDRIHLMITDVIMPGMSGGQLAECLESERPDMRILYISGYPEDAIAHHGVLEEAQSFLQKPFSPAALLDRVRELLDATPRRSAGSPSPAGDVHPRERVDS